MQVYPRLRALRRYWIIMVALLIFGYVLIAGSPGWAVTASHASNKTVPPPKSMLYLPWILLESH